MTETAADERRRTWKQDPEGRRERILEAAQQAFAAKGVRKTRLDDIAQAAGVAEGTVYHLFGNKRGLLEAVGARYGEGLAAAAFANLPESPAEQIETIVRNIFEHVRNTEGAFAAFLLANDPAEGGPAEDANRGRMLAAIEMFLGSVAAQTGLDVDVPVLARLHFNLVESALRDCFLRGHREDEEAYITEAVRMLQGSLREGD